MTFLTVWDDTDAAAIELQTRDDETITEVLTGLGVRFSRWELKDLPETATPDEVLAAYREDIEKVSSQHGYTIVDALGLTPSDDPEYAEKAVVSREKFLREHRHDDDEDRFFARGSGIFYLHVDGKVYAVLCEAGDLISVPANTTHWFDMGTRPDFLSIRFFHDDDGWVGNFTGSEISAKFATFDEIVAYAA